MAVWRRAGGPVCAGPGGGALLAWAGREGAVLEVREGEGEGGVQTLRPIAPPPFPVERLSLSPCGTRLCAWGARGVSVIELPTVRPRTGTTVLCKSYQLDEKFLLSQAEVRRVHWHTASLSHLLVLASDNTIRVYNVSSKAGSKLIRILTIGRLPQPRLAGMIMESLGDITVDFTLVPGSNSLLMLRGNGDVYTIECDLGNDSPIPPKLHGPLTMYPPADDNYGEESCCIMVLGGETTPALVVIATSSAVLYHCVLLPDPPSSKVVSDKTDSGYSLYVMEAVELNIVLSQDDAEMQYSYPVHLYPIPGNNESYVCAHAAGVHAVTLPLMAQLGEYFLTDGVESEGALTGLASIPSVARYILCTHGPGSGFDAPIGVCCSTSAPLPTVHILLRNQQLVTRTLEPYNLEENLYKDLRLKNSTFDQDEISNLLKERQKVSFSSLVKEILKREVSQPILRISSKGEPSPRECLEFLTQATLKLRSEYINKQGRACEVVCKKLRGLRTLSKHQEQWFNEVRTEAEDVMSDAMVLREKGALALKNQNEFRERCSQVLRGLRASQPTTAAERELIKELNQYKRTSEQTQEQISRLKDTMELRKLQLKAWKEEYNKKAVCLGRSHSDTITSIIQQQSAQLSSLIEEVKLLKDQLSI